MAVFNKYELQCCSHSQTVASCTETAALFVLRSKNYGLKGTDAVICLLITILSP